MPGLKSYGGLALRLLEAKRRSKTKKLHVEQA